MPLDLSIVIVNWNTRELLGRCLSSIESHREGLNLDVIVVDNQSHDGSPQLVRDSFPQFLLVESGGNIGFSRANNLALAHARAPLVLFLNPDTEVRPGALQGMVAYMRQHPEVGGLGPRVMRGDGEVQALGLQWYPNPLTELIRFAVVAEHSIPALVGLLPHHDPFVSGRIKKLYGVCLMVRQEVLASVGPFDERFFMYCEDVDLCRRIVTAGWSLHYLAEVEIVHWGGAASGKAAGAFTTLMTCESLGKLMRKYYGPIGHALYRGITLCGALVRLALVLLVGGVQAARGKPSEGYQSRKVKYLSMLKWSLALQRAAIPR